MHTKNSSEPEWVRRALYAIRDIMSTGWSGCRRTSLSPGGGPTYEKEKNSGSSITSCYSFKKLSIRIIQADFQRDVPVNGVCRTCKAGVV